MKVEPKITYEFSVEEFIETNVELFETSTNKPHKNIRLKEIKNKRNGRNKCTSTGLF
jgi:hypothetical protein